MNIYFFLSWDSVLNHHHAIECHSCFYSGSLFLKNAALIIATHGQRALHWQLSKAILSDMQNCNFEAINQVLNKRMKKLEMKYGPLICTIVLYLILCIRFKKDILMLSLRWELPIFVRDLFSYCTLQVQLWFKL